MNSSIQQQLDSFVARYNTPDFVLTDPVQSPRMFTEKRDIEVAALVTSLVTWGARPMILRSVRRILFDVMHGQPYAFVMGVEWEQLPPDVNLHRTFFMRDLTYVCRGLHAYYRDHESLEDLFVDDVWQGIARLRQGLMDANQGQSSKHVSNPETSACKRLHMMLRWLVRRDGIVDLGIWQRVQPSQLYIPLDVHVARVSRHFGLLSRRSNDRKAAEELTRHLRTLDATDPIKYDFALFGAGVTGEE